MTDKTPKQPKAKPANARAGTNPGEVGAGTQPAAGTPAAGSAQPTPTAQPTPESGTAATAAAAGQAVTDTTAGGSSGGQDSEAPPTAVRAEEPAGKARPESPASGDPGAAGEITQDLRVHAAANHVPTDVLFAACAPRPDISHVLSAREYSDRWVLVVMSENRAFKVEVPHA